MKISPSNESEVEVKQGMKEKGMMNGSSKEVKKKNDVSSILIPSMSSYVDERQGNGPEQIFFLFVCVLILFGHFICSNLCLWVEFTAVVMVYEIGLQTVVLQNNKKKEYQHLYFTFGSKTISSRFSPLFTKFNLLHNFKGLVHCSTNYSETDFLTSILQQSTLRTCIVIMQVSISK